MEGVVWLYNPKGFLDSHWPKRYLHLSGQRLRSSSSKTSSTILADYNISSCTVKSVHFFLCGKKNAFQICTNEIFLLLCTANQTETLRWLKCLQDASGRLSNREGLLSPSSARVKLAATAHSQQDQILQLTFVKRVELRQLTTQLRGTANGKLRLSSPTDPTHNGAVLIGLNDHSTVHNTPEEILEEILHAKLPVRAQFLQARGREGVLKMMPTTSKKMFWLHVFPPMKNPAVKWQRRRCALLHSSFQIGPQEGKPNKKLKLKHQLEVAECSVKVVHQSLVAGREHCFLLSCNTLLTSSSQTSQKSSQTTQQRNFLFQAETNEEMVEWVGAIAHCIEVAHGHISALSDQVYEELDDDKQLLQQKQQEDSFNISYVSSDDIHSQLEQELTVHSPTCSSAQPVIASSWRSKGMEQDLVTLQLEGQFVDAIQYMKKNVTQRSLYWPKIFKWALPCIDPSCYEEQLVSAPIHSKDEVQLSKDVPRTTKWLNNSANAPLLTKNDSKKRLDLLYRILHAYIVRSDAKKDHQVAVEDQEDEQQNTTSAYLQGMNGICYVLLQSLEENEVQCFRFFIGVVEKVLPGIFCDHMDDSSNAVSTFAETGEYFERIVFTYLPHLASIFESVGLPVFILAYKWFPTLFSDVSLSSVENMQLSYDTLLAAWDVCFLMGMEGVIYVGLAFFYAANSKINSLPKECLAEDVSEALEKTLSTLTPEWLLDGVCVVMETCKTDERLKKLRTDHLIHLQELAYTNTNKCKNSNKKYVQTGNSTNPVEMDLLTIRNLDTGEVFEISDSDQSLIQLES